MYGYLYTGITRDQFLRTVRALGFPNGLRDELEHATTEDPKASWRVRFPFGDLRWSPEGFMAIENGDYDVKVYLDVTLGQEGLAYEYD